MNFQFITENEATDALHSARSAIKTIRESYEEKEPARKRMMTEFRENKKRLMSVPGDMAGVMIRTYGHLHKVMGETRPPAWYAVTRCEECPSTNVITSKIEASERFRCHACKEPTTIEWVEEHALAKVHAMYDRFIEAEAMKERKIVGAWESKAMGTHRAYVKRAGKCRIRDCGWC